MDGANILSLLFLGVVLVLALRVRRRHRNFGGAPGTVSLLEKQVTLTPEWLQIDGRILERRRRAQAVQLRFREDLPSPTEQEASAEYPSARIDELTRGLKSGPPPAPGSPAYQTFRELIDLTTKEYNPSRWGAIGASGKRVLPEIELRDVGGVWHGLGGHGHLYRWDGSRWLTYSLLSAFASPGPFTALRIRAAEPVTVLQALWFCDDPR